MRRHREDGRAGPRRSRRIWRPFLRSLPVVAPVVAALLDVVAAVISASGH